MIRWFRSRRPVTPAPEPLDQLDRITIVSWGLSPLDWADMDRHEQAWRRDNLTKAPYFNTHVFAS